MPLLLVQSFVNTLDVEEHTDLLDEPDSAADWLTAAGLLRPGAAVSPAELDLAGRVRESIRGLLGEGGGPPDLEPLRGVLADRRPRLKVEDGGVIELENPRHGDVGDALFELLLIIRQAQEDGGWSRLKVCANPDCRWAFYDRSRNQQGNWCDMAVCGNRLKNRQLRARRRT